MSSLRLRLGLVVCLTVLPALGALVLHGYLSARREAEADGLVAVSRVVDLLALDQQRVIDGGRQLAEVLAGMEVVRALEPAGCNRLLAALRPAFPAYAGFGAVRPDGKLVCASFPFSGPVSAADRQFFRETVERRRFTVGEYVLGKVSGEPLLNLGQPVQGESGDLLAVVFVSLDLRWLGRIAREARLPEGSRVLVHDRSGVVLARHPDPEGWVGRGITQHPAARAALAGPGAGSGRYVGMDGTERLYAWRGVGAGDGSGSLYVNVGMPTGGIFASARAAFLTNLALLAAVGAGAFGAAWFGGERIIVRPARALAAAAARMGEGDLGARTGLPHDRGTMGRLARAFDDMAEALAERTARLVTQAGLERALAEAESANTSKSDFLSRVSHELRTPLNAILGFGQILEMSLERREDRESVDEILRAGRRLLELVDEVLDISRAETRRLGLSLEPVDVEEAVSATLELVGPLAAERHIRCHAAGASLPGAYVRADQQRLRQVLLNLIVNGIRHNVEGGSVEVGWEAAGEGRLRIAVTDDGPGIPLDLQSRLFTPFDRLGAETRGSDGAGVGLALSRHLVEAMGGRIGVRSGPGQGSTFWVELLAVESPLASQPAAEARDGVLARESPRGTVLYIEDNLANLRLLEWLLRRRPGIELVPAMQGRLGLELARRRRPDLILLDQHLPDVEGIEVLRRLRDDPQLRDIPVIVLSADTTPGQSERLRAAGARDFLEKPLDVRRLLAMLDDILTVEERER